MELNPIPTIFISIKIFNIMVKDGDLFQENTGNAARDESNRATMIYPQKIWKLTKIKEV